MGNDDKAAPPREIQAPMGMWVKGGTLTSAYEKQLQAEDYDAEQRRLQQDAQAQAAKTGVLPKYLRGNEIDDKPGLGKLSSMNLGGSKTHAAVVLGIRHPKDNEILDWIICELTAQPDDQGGQELVLHMACPRCIKTLHRHSQRAQIHIRQSNRMFWLDTRRAGEVFVNPENPNELVTLAGTITTNDWITCPGLGCGWKFKIDDSIIRTM